MSEEIQRRRVVLGCLRLTRGTALAANYYELRLLVHFIQGKLTIEQVINLATTRLTQPSAAFFIQTGEQFQEWV